MPFTPLHMGPGLAVSLLSGATGKHLGEWGLRILREPRHLPISRGVSFGSAFIGTYSHLFIDSVMHVDVFPFSPFDLSRPLHAIISIDSLHVLCLALAVAGGVVWCGGWCTGCCGADRALYHRPACAPRL